MREFKSDFGLQGVSEIPHFIPNYKKENSHDAQKIFIELKGSKGRLSHHGSSKNKLSASDIKKNPFPKIVGTPDYIAPEVIKDSLDHFARDWWAMGCLFYEFLTGIPPFNSKSVQEIFDKIIDYSEGKWEINMPKQGLDKG